MESEDGAGLDDRSAPGPEFTDSPSPWPFGTLEEWLAHRADLKRLDEPSVEREARGGRGACAHPEGGAVMTTETEAAEKTTFQRYHERFRHFPPSASSAAIRSSGRL